MTTAKEVNRAVDRQYHATPEDEATYRIGTEFAISILARIKNLIASSMTEKKYSVIVRFYEMIRAEVTISDPHVRGLTKEIIEVAIYRSLDNAGYKLTSWPQGQLLIQWYRV